MFRKVELWVVLLILLIAMVSTVAFGALVRQELVGGTKFGFVSKTALWIAEIPYQFRRLLVLNSEMIVKDRFPGVTGFKGTPLDQERYLLLSRFDGQLKEAVVDLIDLRTFKRIHTWNPSVDEMNSKIDHSKPDFVNVRRDAPERRYRIIHPLLTGDGGLIFHNSTPLFKIDKCSKVVWLNQEDQFHHTNEFDEDGNVWVPTHKFPFSIDKKNVGNAFGKYVDDAVTKVSANGDLMYQKSLSEIFVDNKLDYLLFATGDRGFTKDPLHLNDIQPVLKDGPHWKQGDLFLSLRHQSMVFLYRPSTNKVLWIGTGHYFHQHDVDILDENRIAVFNNNSKDFLNGDIVDNHSEVVIYDFSTGSYSKYLNESLAKHEVRTVTAGRSEVFANGDLYVEESNSSRLLYFNADGSLRWSYINRAPDNNVYFMSWSRLLYVDRDLQSVRNIVASGGC